MSDVPEFIKSSEMYSDAYQRPAIDVPIKPASPENLKCYGWMVKDFDEEEVVRVTWPRPGWREFVNGTGNLQSVVEGDFVLRWVGDLLYGDNNAVGLSGAGFVTGRLDREDSTTANLGHRRSHVLVRDANYHPDGGQVFFPKVSQPFVMLLAPAACGDDVTPKDFAAFAFDGNQGFQIAPNVWHSSPFMAHDAMVFRNKQSSVYGSIEVDFVKEYGTYLRIPLVM